MEYCYNCGSKLEERYLPNEGNIPYCPQCQKYVFPIFNIAVSIIVMNKEKDSILLIKQYGGKDYILVAGYVNKGEDLETTVIRELKEEIGIDVLSLQFQRSQFYEKSNTLMCNFSCVVDSMDLSCLNRQEVDLASWFSKDQALENILPNSLAQYFLEEYLNTEK